eukprot:Sro17_g012490.1 n/a (942) ;mRNA; r:121952-124777
MLTSGPDRQGLHNAYVQFVNEVVAELTTNRRRLKLSEQRRRLVSYDPSSALVYKVTDTPCPPSAVEKSTCHKVHGRFNLHVPPGEDANEVYAAYVNATQAAIEEGRLQRKLEKVDAGSAFFVERPSDPEAALSSVSSRAIVDPSLQTTNESSNGIGLLGIILIAAGCAAVLVIIIAVSTIVPNKERKKPNKSKQKSEDFSSTEMETHRGIDGHEEKDIQDNEYYEEVLALLQKNCPDQEENVGALLKQFKSREEELILTLQNMENVADYDPNEALGEDEDYDDDDESSWSDGEDIVAETNRDIEDAASFVPRQTPEKERNELEAISGDEIEERGQEAQLEDTPDDHVQAESEAEEVDQARGHEESSSVEAEDDMTGTGMMLASTNEQDAFADSKDGSVGKVPFCGEVEGDSEEPSEEESLTVDSGAPLNESLENSAGIEQDTASQEESDVQAATTIIDQDTASQEEASDVEAASIDQDAASQDAPEDEAETTIIDQSAASKEESYVDAATTSIHQDTASGGASDAEAGSIIIGQEAPDAEAGSTSFEQDTARQEVPEAETETVSIGQETPDVKAETTSIEQDTPRQEVPAVEAVIDQDKVSQDAPEIEAETSSMDASSQETPVGEAETTIIVQDGVSQDPPAVKAETTSMDASSQEVQEVHERQHDLENLETCTNEQDQVTNDDMAERVLSEGMEDAGGDVAEIGATTAVSAAVASATLDDKTQDTIEQGDETDESLVIGVQIQEDDASKDVLGDAQQSESLPAAMGGAIPTEAIVAEEDEFDSEDEFTDNEEDDEADFVAEEEGIEPQTTMEQRGQREIEEEFTGDEGDDFEEEDDDDEYARPNTVWTQNPDGSWVQHNQQESESDESDSEYESDSDETEEDEKNKSWIKRGSDWIRDFVTEDVVEDGEDDEEWESDCESDESEEDDDNKDTSPGRQEKP